MLRLGLESETEVDMYPIHLAKQDYLLNCKGRILTEKGVFKAVLNGYSIDT